MNFVCAFRGRRDSYEVPLALAETGRLERFVTDIYQTSALQTVARFLPTRVREKFQFRYKIGIPLGKVKCLLASTFLEQLLIRFGRSPASIYARFDIHYSRAAARIARRHHADLFLYSAYALPAFRETFAHNPLKVLFQYHPHANLERSILTFDQAQWRKVGLAFSDHLVSDAAPSGEPEYNDGWKYADHIICASSFTKRSLVEAGADSKRISVVPYGVDLSRGEFRKDTDFVGGGPFHVLFVGSGIQRKGLHHLLVAWQGTKLGVTARLTIVSRVIEPSLKALVDQTRGATLISGVTPRELERLYREASLFCMPSLIEGFGQVYLEALSHGLPVLGTPNTCLPDLGGDEDGVFMVQPGDVNALEAMLLKLSVRLPRNSRLREAARRCSRRFTWPEFRRKIRLVLDSLDTSQAQI